MPLKLDRYTLYLPAPTEDAPEAYDEFDVAIKHVDRLTAEKMALGLGIRAADKDGNPSRGIAFMTLQMWAAAKRTGHTTLDPKSFLDKLIDFDEIKDDEQADDGLGDPEVITDPTSPAVDTD